MSPRTSFPPIMADSEKALDHWVCAALMDAYGPVVDERLPDEWVRLLGAPAGEHTTP